MGSKVSATIRENENSIIIMIPKHEKDHTISSSYRPIRLLSCLSKLCEKRLLARIIAYLGAHNVIPALQFGFRQNLETIEHVNRITSEIPTAFKHREYCSSIFRRVRRDLGILDVKEKLSEHPNRFERGLTWASAYNATTTQPSNNFRGHLPQYQLYDC